MKKLVIIMVVLGIIFIGMLGYKNIVMKTESVSIQEIQNIESYINQIYMWKEVTKEALPKFEDINQAEERWVWEAVKKNMEEDKPSYEEIQEKAKELFGQDFSKQFPKEGTKYLTYHAETNEYESVDVELDQQADLFLLDNIKNIKEGYEVEIIEYLEDDSPMLKEEAEDYVIIKNLKEEEIGRISGTAEEEETELVKRNKDKFTKKKIQLKKEKGKLYVQKVF